MKEDIKIAGETPLKPIGDIAESIGISKSNVEPYGVIMLSFTMAYMYLITYKMGK